MRITNNMMIKNMMRNLNNNLKRMDKVQQQMASGKKFQLPSDDPIGVSKSLKLHTDLGRIEQYKRNVDDALSWMEITESAISDMGDVLQRARELTVQASNGTNTTDDLNKISKEVEELKEHLIELANTTYAGRSIFTGYKTNAPLLDEEGKYKLTNYESGAVATPTGLQLQDSEISEYNVGVAESIEVNTSGIKIFGKYESANPEDGNFSTSSVNGYTIDSSNKTSDSTGADKSYLIEIFDQLKNAMDGGDTDTIEKSIGRIDKVMENLLAVRAEIGAKTNRLELTKNKLESQEINFTELLSKNEDVDMAKVIMDLKMEENVYRASLSAGAKIIQPTLVDFLR
ncbi:flagellar hook-associated protein FlgL [Caldisalinibacter kiritimatiensis]|uniref:Flagellar hook-associated protein FlgL n=1 Tax=Caldisalinibacter kiritimatiensis TaxID=1304284 RepID=R1ARV4_9FIRM|nr:flagellar hook-associated protein FlgL [Caldisalinibacter kiritimatiensis]EOC99391.1 Flagellar hook-associated protein FlgL [Caldisalinibacter kiritimatiensis]